MGGFVCCVAAQAVTLLRGCSYGLRYSAELFATSVDAFMTRCKLISSGAKAAQISSVRVAVAFRALLEALAGRNARAAKPRQSFAGLSCRMTVLFGAIGCARRRPRATLKR